jgi:hypothetical protein
MRETEIIETQGGIIVSAGVLRKRTLSDCPHAEDAGRIDRTAGKPFVNCDDLNRQQTPSTFDAGTSRNRFIYFSIANFS